MAGERIVLYFSEPVDPDTVVGRVALKDRDGALVSGGIDVFNPKVWFLPDEPLFPDTTYDIVVRPGITDIAGNDMKSGWTFSFTTMPFQSSAIDPPVVAATVPERGSLNTLAKNFFPEFYFTQIIDEDTLVYGKSYSLVDMTNGGELVPGTRKNYSIFFDFVPDEELIEGHHYRWIITDAVRNLSGLALDTDVDRVPGGPPIVIDFTATPFSRFSQTALITYPYADADVNGFIEGNEYPTKTNFMVMDFRPDTASSPPLCAGRSMLRAALGSRVPEGSVFFFSSSSASSLILSKLFSSKLYSSFCWRISFHWSMLKGSSSAMALLKSRVTHSAHAKNSVVNFKTSLLI